MIKFPNKRTKLTKDLLKAKKRGDAKELEAFFKKLKDNQLEMLHRAIQTEGKDLASCVLLPKDNDPHVYCCQTWRWPNVQSFNIRRLPVCKSASDTIYICCNPYHWSKLLPESPPPYSCCAQPLQPEDRAPSEAALVFRDSYPTSLTTYGEDPTSRWWCKLAYWEMTKRVGRQFPVEKPFINIFWDVPYGEGLSVKELSHCCNSCPDEVSKARRKIGLGITLSREDNRIWVYNRSSIPIFVNSLTLDSSIDSLPTRVHMEHCLCVFDPIKIAHKDYRCKIANSKGPIDINSVTISFGKGWGDGYSRMEISSCPCWIEILLAPCR
ncbi:Dad [Trypoxylus dichotomus]